MFSVVDVQRQSDGIRQMEVKGKVIRFFLSSSLEKKGLILCQMNVYLIVNVLFVFDEQSFLRFQLAYIKLL